MKKELFYYTFEVVTVNAGLSRTITLTTDADAPFLADALMGIIFQTGTATKLDCLVQFRNDTSGRYMQSKLTNSRLVLTNAESLNPIPVKYWVMEKASISITIQNPNAVNIDASICMRGYKVFKNETEPATK